MGNEQARSKAQSLQNRCKVKCAQAEISFYSKKKKKKEYFSLGSTDDVNLQFLLANFQS